MKKIILGFAITLVSVASFYLGFCMKKSGAITQGQETELFDEKQRKFMDIPLDCTITEFTQKLIQKGFVEYKGEFEELANKEFVRIFAKENVKISLQYTPKSEKVWACGVGFDEYTSWDSLLSDYAKFRLSLIKKYGRPNKDVQYFDSPFDREDYAGREMTAVMLEKCKYECEWDNCWVAISPSKQVFIAYKDTINEKICDMEARAMGLW